jgi:hypothetical protein
LIGRNAVLGNPDKKFEMLHLSQQLARYDGVDLSSQVLWKALNRRIMVQASLGKKGDPFSKITGAKRALRKKQLVFGFLFHAGGEQSLYVLGIVFVSYL